jgi:hypothetical protein
MNEDIYFENLEREAEIIDAELDADDAYREWSETIEKLNQQYQDEHHYEPGELVTLEELNSITPYIGYPKDIKVVDWSDLTWQQVIDRLWGRQ